MSKKFPFSLSDLLHAFLGCNLNVVQVKLLPNVSVSSVPSCDVLQVDEIQIDSKNVTHLCSSFWIFSNGNFVEVDPSFKAFLMDYDK